MPQGWTLMLDFSGMRPTFCDRLATRMMMMMLVATLCQRLLAITLTKPRSVAMCLLLLLINSSHSRQLWSIQITTASDIHTQFERTNNKASTLVRNTASMWTSPSNTTVHTHTVAREINKGRALASQAGAQSMIPGTRLLARSPAGSLHKPSRRTAPDTSKDLSAFLGEVPT